MKLPKLDARGVAHHFLLALIVVGVAVGGTYYLIASHADTCDGMSDPTSSVSGDADTSADSGATSNPDSSPTDCTGDSDPVTAPVSEPENPGLVSCTIGNISTTTPYKGQVLNPSITVSNTTPNEVTPAVSVVITDSTGSHTLPYSFYALSAGGTETSYSSSSAAYTVPYASAKAMTGTVTVTSTDASYNCQTSFTLPTVPTYSMSCTVDNVAASLKPGQSVTPTVTVHNTGNQAQNTLNLNATASDPLNTNSRIDPFANSVYYYKTMPISSLKSGASQTFKLATYPVNNKMSGKGSIAASLGYWNGNTYVTANCSKPFTVTVATIKSVTIKPTDWWHDKDVSFITDGAHGKVAKLYFNSGRGFLKSENEYTYAKNAMPFYNFIYADRGHKIKACETMRTAKYTMPVDIFYYGIAAGHSVDVAVGPKLKVTGKYQNYCQSFTLSAFKDYNADRSFDIWAAGAAGATHNSDTYVANTVFTLE